MNSSILLELQVVEAKSKRRIFDIYNISIKLFENNSNWKTNIKSNFQTSEIFLDTRNNTQIFLSLASTSCSIFAREIHVDPHPLHARVEKSFSKIPLFNHRVSSKISLFLSLSLLPFTPSIHISDHFPFPSSSFSFVSFYTVFITAFIDRHGSRDTNWIALPYQMPRVRQIEILFSSFFFFPFFFSLFFIVASFQFTDHRLRASWQTTTVKRGTGGVASTTTLTSSSSFLFSSYPPSSSLHPFVSSVSTCN